MRLYRKTLFGFPIKSTCFLKEAFPFARSQYFTHEQPSTTMQIILKLKRPLQWNIVTKFKDFAIITFVILKMAHKYFYVDQILWLALNSWVFHKNGLFATFDDFYVFLFRYKIKQLGICSLVCIDLDQLRAIMWLLWLVMYFIFWNLDTTLSNKSVDSFEIHSWQVGLWLTNSSSCIHILHMMKLSFSAISAMEVRKLKKKKKNYRCLTKDMSLQHRYLFTEQLSKSHGSD